MMESKHVQTGLGSLPWKLAEPWSPPVTTPPRPEIAVYHTIPPGAAACDCGLYRSFNPAKAPPGFLLERDVAAVLNNPSAPPSLAVHYKPPSRFCVPCSGHARTHVKHLKPVTHVS